MLWHGCAATGRRVCVILLMLGRRKSFPGLSIVISRLDQTCCPDNVRPCLLPLYSLICTVLSISPLLSLSSCLFVSQSVHSAFSEELMILTSSSTIEEDLIAEFPSLRESRVARQYVSQSSISLFHSHFCYHIDLKFLFHALYSCFFLSERSFEPFGNFVLLMLYPLRLGDIRVKIDAGCECRFVVLAHCISVRLFFRLLSFNSIILLLARFGFSCL